MYKKKIYLIFVILLITGCSSIFYQPTRFLYYPPEKFKIDYKDIKFVSKDGVVLHGWLLKRETKFKESKGLILYFHGNAENLSSHYLSLAWAVKYGYDVFIFDYRGYGRSEGKPTHKGIHYDAISAIKQAHILRNEIAAKKLIVYAQSIGGVIAARAITLEGLQDNVDLLVLDSTFTSFKRIANQKMKDIWIFWPFLPLTYFMSDEYASEDYIEKIKVPTLVIHGDKDQVVPFKNGENLYKRIQVKKEFWKIPDGEHTDIFAGPQHGMKYQNKFIDYLETL